MNASSVRQIIVEPSLVRMPFYVFREAHVTDTLIAQ